ncbi:MAG TPA: hypothetical protein VJ816_05465 [Gemmatimonadales bacterium]|nr:hypothetical protein [Gemmatimonadales bacterium]
MRDWPLYRRWVLANGWSECLGLGATGVLGWWIMRLTGEPASVVAVLGTALLAVTGGVLFEGILVGYAQARVLHARITNFGSSQWILATAIGAGIAWLLGMIPSTAMALAGPAAAGEPPAWLGGPAQYLLAAAMGLVLGPILGIPQMLVLRWSVPRASRWVLANALAWMVGMPLVFLGAGAVPDATSAVVAMTILGLTCLTAGIVVGAVHGLFLIWLLADPSFVGPASHRDDLLSISTAYRRTPAPRSRAKPARRPA